MSAALPLLMISAMYENGGNVTQRSFDGHPELYVYPFESQIGTRLVNDLLTSTFPVKYRWPVFDLDASPQADYRAIIDEECKVRARTPDVSKFRHVRFDFSDDERLQYYVAHVAGGARSSAHNVGAFFKATFEAWKDHRRTGREKIYVGYSPIIVVDAAKILSLMPNAHVLHVVRNPWSAYADTKKRPVPMSLTNYMTCWSLNQLFALQCKDLYPKRMHIMRSEDVMADPLKALKEVCDAINIEPHPNLAIPSWNGEPLAEIYPWGTIRRATPAANRSTADELNAEERPAIARAAGPYLKTFGYEKFLDS